MQIKCPTCSNVIIQNSHPIRGPCGDGSEAWLCFKCPAVICVYCYMQHTEKAHPEVYGLVKRPTVGGKKNKKRKK